MIVKNISLLFLIVVGSMLFTSEEIGNIETRIEKRVQKLFKGEKVELHQIPDMPKNFIETTGEIYSRYEVRNDKGNSIAYVFYGMTHVCYFGGCTTYTDQSKNVNREEVKYIIYFDTTSKIKYIDIVDFESNYGYEISAKWWLRQFYNKQPGKFEIGVNIDGISGATVSCEQMTQTINGFVESDN